MIQNSDVKKNVRIGDIRPKNIRTIFSTTQDGDSVHFAGLRNEAFLTVIYGSNHAFYHHFCSHGIAATVQPQDH